MRTLQMVLRPYVILTVSTAITALLSMLLLSEAAHGATGVGLAWAVLAVSCSGLLLAAFAAASVGRKSVQAMHDLAQEIANVDGEVEGRTKTVMGELQAEQFQPVLTALEGLRERLSRASAPDPIASIRHAIENVNLDLLLTDENDQVAFVSEDLGRTLNSMIAESGRESGSRLQVGSPVEILSSDASVKDALRGRKSTPVVAELEQDDWRFRLKISSLKDDEDNFVGNLVVCENRSADSLFEQNIQQLVKSAAAGDLTSRVESPTSHGFKYNLAAGINELMALCESVIADTTRVLGALAAGRLDEIIETEYQGAFEQLKIDANSTVARLKDVVANIQQSSESVSTAFREINEGNLNLSQRTEQQAASLEETSCSMEEMTATVQKNAENAQRANDLAIKARDEAQNGGRVVGQAVTAMTEINAASEKIADIIGVIDEIAFQTNLLALNASVEAARAGEQGRGFAVVAGEVRNLAGRSAEAAKEIKDLIQDSVTKVEKGSALVNQSGQTLDQIVAGVQEVTDIVAEISAASMEQASGIAEVNATITQMDDMTQQNAALVEEVSAASESAGEQAQNLSTLITFFKTDHLPAPAIVPMTPFSPSGNPPLQQRWTPEPVTAISGPAGVAQAANSDLSGDWEEF